MENDPIMRCYACQFAAGTGEWGDVYASGSEWTALIGNMAGKHLGQVKVWVCPNCGAMHSSMRGAITASDRK
jgi:hypothetical protein